jgi:hypothetical protein
VLATVNLDRGAFSCALSRGQDRRLFVVGQNFGGPEPAQPSGRVVAFPGARAGRRERRHDRRELTHPLLARRLT